MTLGTISCDCSCTDYDSAKVYRSEIRKARKVHECCECGEDIERGQKYEYVAGCWDGNWSDYRTCLPCVAIRTHYCKFGWLFGELDSTLRECVGVGLTEVPEYDEDD